MKNIPLLPPPFLPTSRWKLKIKRVQFLDRLIKFTPVYEVKCKVGRTCSFSMKIENDEVCIFYTSILAPVLGITAYDIRLFDDPFLYRDTNLIYSHPDRWRFISRRFFESWWLILSRKKKKISRSKSRTISRL